jgi:RNA polymerase sigma-70 factor (ECF subfamily)
VPGSLDKNTEFLKLYNSAQPLLRGYLLAWLHDYHRAEDILQETSLVLWERFGQFRPGESFSAWALGIARNLALQELRRLGISERLANPEVLDAVAATCERMAPELEARRRALAGCLEKLSDALRRLVDLFYGRSLSVADVARQTGRSPGGVEVSLFRARQALADCTRRALEVESP